MPVETKKAIYLCGGLGNQLFQVARGLSILSPGDELECLYDSSLTRTLQDGLPEISMYKLEPKMVFKKTQTSRIRQKIVNFGIRISTGNSVLPRKKGVSRLARIGIEQLLTFTLKTKLKTTIADNTGYCDDIRVGKDEPFIGYSQSFHYAEELKKPENLAKIKLKTISKEAEKLISSSRNLKPIIMHVRLGDYVSEPNFGLLSSSYFLEALNLPVIKEHNRQIWIFSNDPESAQDLLKLTDEARYLLINDEGLTSSEVLEVMRNGSAYILSNSTFGWWGAFLSYTKDAPVVVPAKWFKKYPTPSSIYPPEWITFAPQNELFQE